MVRRSWSTLGAALLLSTACAPKQSDSVEPPAAAETTATTPARVVTEEAVPLEIKGSPVLPRGLTSFGAAHADGALYVLGGYFGKPHEYSEAGQTGEMLRLDVATNTWTRLGEIDKAQGVALVAHDGALYRIGGMQARNAAGTPADLHSLDTVERFDIATSSWTTLPPLPQPRSSHDAIVLDGVVWVVGGWSMQGDEKTWHRTIARMDLSDPAAGWTEIDAPFQRRALAVAAVGGRVVALGGIDSERNLSTRVDVYDPAAGQWSEGPAFPGPGFGMAAGAHGSWLFASGMDGAIHRWRPGDAAWAPGGTLAYPRFFHRMVPTGGGELLVVGGIRKMKTGTRVRPIERVLAERAPDQTTWLAYSMPSPMPSKNRQGVAQLEDSLFFFGGNKSLGQHDFGPEFFTAEGQAVDLASLQWRPIAPYPVPRQTMSTFVTDWGQIVSVGGFGHDGEVARSHPEIYAYHPGKDRWNEIGRLPKQGRTQFGLAVREEQVVLFGGLDYDPRRPKRDQFRHERGLLAAPLQPSGMEFAEMDVELREPRRAFAGALLDERYYVIGGMREGFALVDSCEAYDFKSKKWSTIACPQRPRLSAKVAVMGGKLYLAAGSSRRGPEDKLGPDPSLEVYDPATDRWTMLVETLPIEPKHLSMRAYGERLVLASTHNDDGLVHIVLVDPPR